MSDTAPERWNEEQLFRTAELFQAFADPTRVRILYLLSERERCVGEIAAEAGVSQSAVSHQLKLLRQLCLIRSRRDGKAVRYALADYHVKTILDMAREHLEEPG